MMFVDRMFLCWISEKAVAAVLPAGMTYYALVCLPLGVASYVNTFVAQAGFGHWGLPALGIEGAARATRQRQGPRGRLSRLAHANDGFSAQMAEVLPNPESPPPRKSPSGAARPPFCDLC